MSTRQDSINPAAAQLFVGGSSVPRTQSVMAFPSEIEVVIDQNRLNADRNFKDYIERNRSLLNRIFPNKMDRLLRDAEMQWAQTDCDRHLRLLELAYATKYEACEEMANAWLQAQKVEIRTRVASVLASNLVTLSREIETYRQGYAEHIAKRYASLDRDSVYPKLRAAMEGSIDLDIDKTITWLDSLLDGYRRIHLERILTSPSAR